jgi:phosphoribosyl 1,2-cyclic phosphodiesterase
VPVVTDAPDPYLLVLGVRGSIPVAGPRFDRYGGNSTCFALVDDGRIHASIDAGSGLVTAQIPLADQVTILLTHYHWDHIQGLSMLGAMWAGDVDLRIVGQGDPHAALSMAIRPPVFPVSIDGAPRPIEYVSAADHELAAGVLVRSFPVHHPQGAVGYKLIGPNRTIAVVTDHESHPAFDEIVAEQITGVDVLIHDAQYTAEEYEARVGWGHSTWEHAAKMAARAGVGELYLTSHDPWHDDDMIDEVVAWTRDVFPGTKGLAEGNKLAL